MTIRGPLDQCLFSKAVSRMEVKALGVPPLQLMVSRLYLLIPMREGCIGDRSCASRQRRRTSHYYHPFGLVTKLWGWHDPCITRQKWQMKDMAVGSLESRRMFAR